jgi:hypothetical protein
MAVGTLTCTSYSAHVYLKDYDAARAVYEKHRGPVTDWDMRSHFRIRTVETEEPREAYKCSHLPIGTEALADRCNAPAIGWRTGGFTTRLGYEMLFRCEEHRSEAFDDESEPLRPLPRKRKIVAEAYAPEGDRLLAVFEGETASVVSLQIARSGLVTVVGHAMYIGRELEKAEREVGGGS